MKIFYLGNKIVNKERVLFGGAMPPNATDLRKHIGSSLQTLRRRAGYKSAKAFADSIGINPNTYTQYEQGVSGMSYERAWEIADALGCTLDELGGRTPPSGANGSFQDPMQGDLNRYFESMNNEGRSALVASARLMSGSPDVRIEKDKPEDHGVSTAMGA